MPSLSFITRYCFYWFNNQDESWIKIIFINNCFKNILWKLAGSTRLRRGAILGKRTEEVATWKQDNRQGGISAPRAFAPEESAWRVSYREGSRHLIRPASGQTRVGLALPRQAATLDSEGTFWGLLPNSKPQLGFWRTPCPTRPKAKGEPPGHSQKVWGSRGEEGVALRAQEQGASRHQALPWHQPTSEASRGIPESWNKVATQGVVATTPRETVLDFFLGPK